MTYFTEKINFIARGYIQLLLSYCQEIGQNKTKRQLAGHGD